MTRTLPPVLLPLALMLFLLLGCGTEPASRVRQASAEWVRPFDGYLPECASEGVAVLRVVDARTHKPIQGATVRKHYEIEAGPKGWAPVAEKARTDAYGLVWFEPSEDWRGGQEAHWSVEAPGYATTQEYGYAPQHTFELHPPRTCHGRIIDALGRPLVGMAIGYKEGCGHSPFLTETTTDDDGRFVISGVGCDGDVFFAARGVLGDYFRGPLRPLKETPHTHVASPAIRLRGRIAGAQPQELGARVVHALAEQRGPFGRIEDDGRFVIDGLDRDGLLTLWSDARGETRELSLNRFRPGGPLVWDLRLSRDDDPTDSDTVAKRRLRVFVKDEQGTTAPNISVAAYRAVDGREQDSADDVPEDDPEEDGVKPPGEVSLELLPGAYDLVVCPDGGPWHADPVRIEIGKEPPAPVTIHARALPRLELIWPGKDVDAEAWMLTYAEADGFINMEALSHNGAHLPATALARVAVPGEDRTWFFDVAPAVDGVRKAVVKLPAPRRLRFSSIYTPDTVAIGGVAHEFTQADDGRFEVLTELEGSLELALDHSDRRGKSKRWSFRLITLGKQPVLDLGEIVWTARPSGTLTLLDAAGQPVPDQQVEIEAIDTRAVSGLWEDAALTTDDAGKIHSPLLRAGAWLHVTNTEPKIYRHLDGAGPWAVRLGDATLELEVHGRYGILTTAHLMVDGERFSRAGDDEDDRRPARYAVKTLAAGPHIVLITAPGHRGEARRVVLKPGETRRIRVDLPERD